MERKVETLRSYITEFEEMYEADYVHKVLGCDRTQAVQRELMFLKTIMWCYENRSRINSTCATKAFEAVDCLFGLFKELEEMIDEMKDVIEDEILTEFVLLISDTFLEKLHYIKTLTKEGFHDFLDHDLSLEFKYRRSKVDFKNLIHIAVKNLKDLLVLKPDMIEPVKKQIIAFEKRLEFVYAIFHFASRDHHQQLSSFFKHLKDWANTAAGVPFLYWVDENDERLNTIVSRLIEKFKPCTLELAELYLGVLMALKPSDGLDFSLKQIAVARFLEILLEDLVLKATLEHGLTFFISFLINPSNKYANLISTNEVASLICSLYAKERNAILHDLIEKINQIKELHLNIGAASSSNNFPMTNVQGFIDFFLEDLREKFKCHTTLTTYQRNQIMIVQKDLLCLQPLLKGIFELQDGNEELNDLRMQISNMAYRAECVIDSCFVFYPTNYWHNVMRLSDVTEEIQWIKAKVNKPEHAQMCNSRDRVLSDDKMNSGAILSPQSNNIRMDDVHMVGFVDEKEKIINCLTGGLPQLDIVAIVGMPGQGKTTLSNKLYQDRLVRLRFQKHAWCCISQSYSIKVKLIDILKQVNPTLCDGDISDRSHEDLAEMLYKCLKGRTYLIVLDDIWDIGAWNELKASFPDDANGSRILFTSRIHKVALEAKHDCSLHELHPLSPEDSLQLLQQKLSYKNGIPPNLLGTGKRIAENCKGLPLAIVVIAGLLAKAKTDVAFWKQTAENMKSRIAREGCMDILELSYQHLPAYLRPCFLYLGVFQDDEIIVAKRLMRYWIAEGFIQKQVNKSLEDVANEYLMDLRDRSLLFVAKRSSRFGIKKCFVHDLIREFCVAKAKEQFFLLVPNISDNNSIDTLYQSYRLCFHTECWLSFQSEPTTSMVRTLHFSKPVKIPKVNSFFIRFELLRVLDLAAIKIYFDIGAIMQLVLLRYLALVGVFEVPSSIANLSRLEFLRLKTSRVLPTSIWNMTSLKHLYLSTALKPLGIDYVSDKSLQLDKLETFSLDCRTGLKEVLKWRIRRMPNIRKLSIKSYLSIGLLSFLNKLESLNLDVNFKERSAAEFNLPCTLVKLTLRHFSLSTSIISAIGKLPNLEVLKLFFAKFEEKMWDVEDEEFLKIKYLKLRHADIEKWNVSTGSFPRLEQLILKSCYKLTEAPSTFGELSTLKVMKVFDCSKLANSVREIVAEQQDLGDSSFEFTTDFSDEE